MTVRTIALVLALAGTITQASQAQSLLYVFDGDSRADLMGVSVSGAGDVDSDGFDDFIVGAIGDDNNGELSGSARVFSGSNGSVLYTFDGDSPGDELGRSVSGAGDVNGDGFDDLIVGAWFDNNNGKDSGSARVFSGANGSILYTFDGDSAYDSLGRSVSGAGDVNGDGFADLVVGAPFDNNNGDSSGSARVFSGKDGAILYTFDGDSPWDKFGWSVSGAGDVNRDGFADVIVGAVVQYGFVNSGYARVFSGADGSILHTFDTDTGLDNFGWSVSGAGDVDGDGFADLIVGAPSDDPSGSAYVFSGRSGSTLHVLQASAPWGQLGLSVSGAGDTNGDGVPDLIVGDNQFGLGLGYARVFSGKDGSSLLTIKGSARGDASGWSVSGAGDVDGDGLADLVVGVPSDNHSAVASGRVLVFSGFTAIGTSYCGPANPNSTGQSAVIRAGGSSVASENQLSLVATDLPANRLGLLLASRTQAFVPFAGGSQGNLCLGARIVRFANQIQDSGWAGSITIQVDLTSLPTTPPHTVMAGETWNFQAWFRDVNPGPTSNFTDAVSVLFN